MSVQLSSTPSNQPPSQKIDGKKTEIREKEVISNDKAIVSSACKLLREMRNFSMDFSLNSLIRKNRLIFSQIQEFIKDSLENSRKTTIGCQKTLVDQESYILDHYLGKDQDKFSKPKFIKGSNKSLKTIKIRTYLS